MSGFWTSWGWWGVFAAVWLALMAVTLVAFLVRLLLYPRDAPDLSAPENAGLAQSYERSSQRMAALDLVKRAGQRGWDVSGRTIEIADFLHGVREAGLDARIRMWGRPYRSAPSAVMTELHRLIPVHHWKDFEFDVGTIAGRDDNFETKTCNLQQNNRHEGGYADIYVDRQAAIDWLDSDAEKFKRAKKR